MGIEDQIKSNAKTLVIVCNIFIALFVFSKGLLFGVNIHWGFVIGACGLVVYIFMMMHKELINILAQRRQEQQQPQPQPVRPQPYYQAPQMYEDRPFQFDAERMNRNDRRI